MIFSSTSLSLLLATTAHAAVFRMDYLPVGHVRTDPIISQTCLSDHVHSFYGPPLLHPSVTYDELRASDPATSSGNVQENLSLYWHPTVYMVEKDGTRKIVHQEMTTVYYFWDKSKATQAFPPGFRMIGGMDASRSDVGCAGERVCQREDCSSSNSFFPTSACRELEAGMTFPSCWDGVNLDSNDHMSHMAYVDDLEDDCPSSHPVRLPLIEFFFRIMDYEGGHHEFSDGTGIFHADYISGWDEQFLQDFLDQCEPDAPDYKNCNAVPLTFRKGVQYKEDETSFQRELQNAKVPLANTSCTTTEAIHDIKVLPRGTCQGNILSTAACKGDGGFEDFGDTGGDKDWEEVDEEEEDDEEEDDENEDEDENEGDEDDEDDEEDCSGGLFTSCNLDILMK